MTEPEWKYRPDPTKIQVRPIVTRQGANGPFIKARWLVSAGSVRWVCQTWEEAIRTVSQHQLTFTANEQLKPFKTSHLDIPHNNL